MIATRPMTAEDLAAMPDDGNHYELLRGELVTMPPTGFDHGIVSMGAGWHLKNYVRETDAGEVVMEVGFVLSRNPLTVLAPDVAFVRRDRVPDPAARAGFVEMAPDLAVEVVSPSNTAAALQDKILTYLEAGVRLVLVLEPTRRVATVHTPDRLARTLLADETFDGGEVLPGFKVLVADLFR